ncbi:hypothetical protein D3C76_1313610 [compost metagenome]
MGLLADDVLVTALAMGHQPQQIAHGPGRHEQRRGKPQALGQFGFQTIDRRIFAIHVVAGGGFGHRVQHAGAGLGDGVAAKIDNAHESGLGKQGKSLSGKNYCGHGDD